MNKVNEEQPSLTDRASSPRPAHVSPRCPKCGFVMCEQFDTQRINEHADLATASSLPHEPNCRCIACAQTVWDKTIAIILDAADGHDRWADKPETVVAKLRAARDRSPLPTAEAYEAHLRSCRECVYKLCVEGARLWEANGSQPAYIRQANIGASAEVDKATPRLDVLSLLPDSEQTQWRDSGRFIPSYAEGRNEYANRRSILRDNVIVADAYGERAASLLVAAVNAYQATPNAALAKFTKHDFDCDIMNSSPPVMLPCTCGLDAAKAAAYQTVKPADIQAQASEIADDLFCNGQGDEATRLVLVVDDDSDALNPFPIGGWCKRAVVERIAAALAASPDALPVNEACEWKGVAGHGLEFWSSQCGRNNLNAPPHGSKFCCFCRKPIREYAGKAEQKEDLGHG